MAERVIYLVRHAQADQTKAPADQFGPGLTETGRRQAELTAQRLSALPVAVIHHSPMRRAVQTAEIIAARLPGVPLQPSPLLRECIPYLPASFKDWYTRLTPEEASSAELEAGPANSLWLSLCPRQSPWEEIEAGQNQAEAAYQKYFRRRRGLERHEVIVFHGNLLRYFVCRAFGVPPEAWANTDIRNCGVCEIRIRPNGSTLLISHNDTGHLPVEMWSYI